MRYGCTVSDNDSILPQGCSIAPLKICFRAPYLRHLIGVRRKASFSQAGGAAGR